MTIVITGPTNVSLFILYDQYKGCCFNVFVLVFYILFLSYFILLNLFRLFGLFVSYSSVIV